MLRKKWHPSLGHDICDYHMKGEEKDHDTFYPSSSQIDSRCIRYGSKEAKQKLGDAMQVCPANMLPFAFHELETPPGSCLKDTSREDQGKKSTRGPILQESGSNRGQEKKQAQDPTSKRRGQETRKRNKNMQMGHPYIMPTGYSRQMFCTQQPCAAAMQSYKDICPVKTPNEQEKKNADTLQRGNGSTKCFTIEKKAKHIS